ncbi:hypothetical protein Tco_0787400 [Tanacetum coccineum]
MAPNCRGGASSGTKEGENLDIVALIAQQLQAILPEIVTQVTNHMNNANGGDGANGDNSGNNGCSYKGFLACVACGRVLSKQRDKEVRERILESYHAKRITRYINGLAPQIHGMLRVTQPTTIQGAILIVGILTNEAVHCGTLTRSGDKRKEVGETSWYPKCTKCNALVMHPENT